MPDIPTLAPISTTPLSVILLARDSVIQVDLLLPRWLSWLDRRGQDYEVLLIDDGSSDGTADRAEALSSKKPRLRVVHHETPLGQGAALRTGLSMARHPLIYYCPFHPDYRPEHLGQFLERTVSDPKPMPEIDRVHLMNGYRAGIPVSRPWRAVGWLWWLFCRVVLSYSPQPSPGALGWRRQLGWLAARLLFGLRYRDVACPARLLRRDILPRIPLQSNGPFAHVELLAKANFLGCLMGEEVPLDIRPPAYQGDAWLWYQEGRRVVEKPDFGPPVLPTTATEDAPPPAPDTPGLPTP